MTDGRSGNAPDHDRTDDESPVPDPLLGLRERGVELLPPRPGAFDDVRAGARRRQRVQRLGSAAAVVVVLTALGSLYPVLHGVGLFAGGPAGSPPSGIRSPGSVPGAPAGPVPAGFAPQSVTFASPSVGWALGVARCRRPPCPAVVRTTDAGRSWHGVPGPPVRLGSRTAGAGGGSAGVTELRFGSLVDGFAYGPELWTTHDGARRWSRVDVGPVRDLEIAGGRAYAVVGVDCGQPPTWSCGSGDQLLVSDVGSAQWQAAPLRLDPPGGPVSLTVGDGSAYLLQGGARPALYGDPGGAGWRRLAVPCANLAAVSMAGSPLRLVGVCADGTVHRSEDAASTWTSAGAVEVPATGPPGGVGATGDTGGSGNVTGSVTGSAAVGANRVFVATGGPVPVSAAGAALAAVSAEGVAGGPTAVRAEGPAGDLARPAVLGSGDGGLSWRPLLRCPGGASYIGFTTPSQGFAVPARPDGRIWFSYDAGETWSAYRFR